MLSWRLKYVYGDIVEDVEKNLTLRFITRKECYMLAKKVIGLMKQESREKIMKENVVLGSKICS